MKYPQFLQRLYVRLFNHYWFSCPLCGERVDSHDWDTNCFILTKLHKASGVCSSCKEDANIYNEKWLKEHYLSIANTMA